MRKKIMSIIIIFVMVFILVCKNTYVAMAASGDGNDIKDEDNESQEEIKEGTEEGSKEDTLLEDEIDIIPPSLSYEALDYKDIFSKKYIMGNSVRLRVNVSDDSDGEITLILYSEYFGESDNSVVTEYGRWTVSEGEQYIDIDEGMLSDAIKLKAIDESGNDNVVIVNSNEYVLDNNAPKLSIEKSDADYEEDGVMYYKDFPDLNINMTEEEMHDSGIAVAYYEINGVRYDINILLEENWEETLTEYISYELNLADISVDNNHYEISFYVEDHVGHSASEYMNVCVDTDSPELYLLTINGNILGFNDKYGYIDGEAASVAMGVRDNEGGSGIKEIHYFLDDGKDSGVLSVDDEGKTSLEISPDYKGRIHISVIDNVGNESEQINSAPIILESEKAFTQNANVDIELPQTEYTDAEGNPLYPGDIVIPIQVYEKYAGIDSVAYEIYSDDDLLDVGLYPLENGKYESNIVIAFKTENLLTYDLNNLSLVVRLIGNVGYEMIRSTRFSIDKTAPIVNMHIVSGTEDSDFTGYYSDQVGIDIDIQDINYDSGLVELSINGIAYDIDNYLVDKADSKNSFNRYHILFSDDGEYRVDVKVKDRAGHYTEGGSLFFVIDSIPPSIEVYYEGEADSEDFYYNRTRRAVVTIVDDNYTEHRVDIISDNGNEFQATSNGEDICIQFLEEGKYKYHIEAMDKAGNKSDIWYSREFVLDMTMPEIVIDGLKEGDSINGDLVGNITAIDKHLDYDSINLKVHGTTTSYINEYEEKQDSIKESFITGEGFELSNIPYDKAYDGKYCLEICAKDFAKNERKESLSFTINRYGSDYYLSDQTKQYNGMYLQNIGDLELTEINVDELQESNISIIYNGKTDILGEEMYQSIHSYDDNRNIYTYVIGGNQFMADGSYTVIAESVDLAGNVNNSANPDSDAAISFIIDNTNPLITNLTLQNGMVVDGNSQEASFYIKDNTLLESVYFELNGEMLTDYQTDENGKYTIYIQEATNYQDLKVYAIDKAGNEAIFEVNDILITTNFFIQWLHNRTLFVGSIFEIVGGLGLCMCQLRKIFSRRKTA